MFSFKGCVLGIGEPKENISMVKGKQMYNVHNYQCFLMPYTIPCCSPANSGNYETGCNLK